MSSSLNFSKLKTVLLILRYAYVTIKFNFKYLPFDIAKKLPFIFECGAKFYTLSGKITIESDSIKMGMIRFQSRSVGGYDPNLRFIFENQGHIIFKGRGMFYAGSSVSVGPKGVLTFGESFSIGPLNKIVCLNTVTFGKNSLLAWEIMVLDSDFHHVYNFDKNELHINTKPIVIGDNCWIGSRAMIYKGTIVPDNTIIAGMSVLNKEYKIDQFCLLTGNPAAVKAKNISRLLDDSISEKEITNKINEFSTYTKIH